MIMMFDLMIIKIDLMEICDGGDEINGEELLEMFWWVVKVKKKKN